MSIEEDRIELTGSDYEKKLYILKEPGCVMKYLVRVSSENWEFRVDRPRPGEGSFIEKMADGSCRRFNNEHVDETSYHLV